jgi:hypothetical protein
MQMLTFLAPNKHTLKKIPNQYKDIKSKRDTNQWTSTIENNTEYVVILEAQNLQFP